MSLVIDTNLKLAKYGKGKVRDTYSLGGDKLLMVSTDRLSAFDVVLPTGIPDKGIILNQMSAFWFAKTFNIVPNHLVESLETQRSMSRYLLPRKSMLPQYLLGRSMVIYKAERIPVECVVRGYITGSAWKEYQKSGTINGEKAPAGLIESQELPEPLFTPTTKADEGHDMPLTRKQLADQIGTTLARQLCDKSIALYEFARKFALSRGIIIADTKFEFGYIDNKIHLIDEALTPDSSRFWDAQFYQPGQSQPNFDKQFVRDWLLKKHWNQKPPAPVLPQNVVEATVQRYHDAFYLLTGREPKYVFS